MMRVIILFSALHRTLDQKSGAKPQENSGSKAKPGCCTWLNLNESLSSLPISLPVPLLLFLFLSFRLYTLFFCTRKRRLMGLKSKKKKKQKKNLCNWHLTRRAKHRANRDQKSVFVYPRQHLFMYAIFGFVCFFSATSYARGRQC